MKFSCHHCATVLEAPDELRGLRSSCPCCGRMVQAPSAPRASGPADPGSREGRGGMLEWACASCGALLKAEASMSGHRAPCPQCRVETGPAEAAAGPEGLRDGSAMVAPRAAPAGRKANPFLGEAEDGDEPEAAAWRGLVDLDPARRAPTFLGPALIGDRARHGRSGEAEVDPLIGLGAGSGPRQELPGERSRRSQGEGATRARGDGPQQPAPALAGAAPRSGWVAVGLLLMATSLSFALAWGLRERPDAQNLNEVSQATLTELAPGSSGQDAITLQELDRGRRAQEQLARILRGAETSPQRDEPSLRALNEVLRSADWEQRRNWLVFDDPLREAEGSQMLARSLPLKVRELDSRWRLEDGRIEQYWVVQEVPPGYLPGLTATLPRGQFLVAVVETGQGWKVRGDSLVAMQTRALERMLKETEPTGTEAGQPRRFQGVLRRLSDDAQGRPRLELLSYASPSAAMGTLPWIGARLSAELRQERGDCQIASFELAWVAVEEAGEAGEAGEAAGATASAADAALPVLPLFEPAGPDAVRESRTAAQAGAEHAAPPASEAGPPRRELAVVGVRVGPWGGPGVELPRE